MTPSDARRRQIVQWLTDELAFPVLKLEPASADASFRRYFRVWHRNGTTRVVMDAPPDKEDIGAFLEVGALLERCGVHVPHVDAADKLRGLVLLEDLGSTPYLSQLRAAADPDVLYAQALQALLRIQTAPRELAQQLPPYDRAALERELALMPEWFCARHLRLNLDDEERGMLAHSFEFLSSEALAQPVVFVHRDYHSRNLMFLPHDNPGIIDFQDALAGPVGYDLVSLLKDCYIDWPRARVERWVGEYRSLLMRIAGPAGPAGASEREFLRWFDLIGLQRHIKVLGVFSRLWYRDAKSGYLPDLPRTLAYVRDAAGRFDELRAFADWLERRVLARFAAANQRSLAEAAALERSAGGM
jgi:aminoglycoside/choline kinase family phosphotransferase